MKLVDNLTAKFDIFVPVDVLRALVKADKFILKALEIIILLPSDNP